MRIITAICFVVLITLIYKHPPTTATIEMKDGTITTAGVPSIVGSIAVNENHPMFVGLFGEYVIGTGNELAKTEQVKIIKLESMW